MNPKTLLRVAAGCLLFFATGHTIGHFTRHSVKDPKAIFVLDQMSINKFDMFGKMRSYDENYTGMSLNLIFTLVSFSVILLLLANITNTNSKLVRQLIIPIALCIAGFSITSFLFFFPMPAVACFIAVAALALAFKGLK